MKLHSSPICATRSAKQDHPPAVPIPPSHRMASSQSAELRNSSSSCTICETSARTGRRAPPVPHTLSRRDMPWGAFTSRSARSSALLLVRRAQRRQTLGGEGGGREIRRIDPREVLR